MNLQSLGQLQYKINMGLLVKTNTVGDLWST